MFSAESPDPCDVETLAAALASMNKSKSSPHVSCLSMGRRSLKLRWTFTDLPELNYHLHHLLYHKHFFNNRNKGQNYMVPRISHLIEITINGE